MPASYVYSPTTGSFLFAKPLTRATILRRPNRFIVEVLLAGEVERVHCPVTGTIGGFKLDGMEALLQGPHEGKHRSTRWTLAALAPAPALPGEEPAWVGVDQTAVNSYVEALLLHQQLPELLTVDTLKREQRLGASRLDFLANGDTFVEVKLPLRELQVETPPGVERKPLASAGAADRMMKQLLDMEGALAAGQQAAILTVFIYPNPGFRVAGKWNPAIFEAVEHARLAGITFWQLNLEITPFGFRRTFFGSRQPRQIAAPEALVSPAEE
jgi:sugar fermentation stimulation protein A